MTANYQNTVFVRVGSALFYGISSFMITVVNKMVLTTFNFPSFEVLGIGQMLATLIVLFTAKKLRYVDFPNLEVTTFTKIWPLPVIYIGNMIFGLGGTKQLSLPMFTALRRFSILMTMIAEYYILGIVARTSIQLSVYTMILGAIIAAVNDLAFNLQDSFAVRRLSTHKVFTEDFTKNHVSLSVLQRAVLTAGSAALSLTNPFRGDMIACLGEMTGEKALVHCLRRMQSTPEGQRIFAEKPRINSSTVDLPSLKRLPDGTIGKTYYNFLEVNDVTPDSRAPVKFIDDIELAYVMQRYREVHDIFHAVLLMPTTMLGEVTVKWIEALQTDLPMCISGAIFGAFRLRSRQRKLYINHYLPWALNTGKRANFLLGIYFEERWEQPLEEFHKEMNIVPLT